jgi:hypothetical protein
MVNAPAETAAPVYADSSDPIVAPLGARVLALCLALGCLTVLLLAAWLEPNPKGFGSHTPLGLQRCAWQDRTGLPCPSCGMTTSFTWFVRGNLAASLYVQPMGMVLALLAAGCVSAGFYIAVTGRPIYRLLAVVPSRYYLTPLFAWAILAWVWKMWIHVNGLDGWR